MFKSKKQFKIFSFKKRQTPNFLNEIGDFEFHRSKGKIAQVQKTTRRTLLRLEKQAQRDLKKAAQTAQKMAAAAQPKQKQLPRLNWLTLSLRRGQAKKRWRKRQNRISQLLDRNEKKLLIFRKRYLKNDSRRRTGFWWSRLAYFSIALLLLIAPFKMMAQFQGSSQVSFKDRVLNKTKDAWHTLQGGGQAAGMMDLRLASRQFTQASEQFAQAESDLKIINDHLLALASFSKDPQLKLAAESKKFLRIGVLGSELAAELSASLSGWETGGGDWLSLLSRFEERGQHAQILADNLVTELAGVNENNLPAEYRAIFQEVKTKAVVLPETMDLLMDNAGRLKKLIGGGQDKRYLLVFQNNAEMRGSGGFLGSYALVDFRDGKITNLEVPGGGSYDTEAGLKQSIKAPEPLWLVNPKWHFWDANWWPDWPTTARNLMWFFEKSDGPTVDGVISLTPSVVEQLLTITGPIDLTEDYGLIINADNFWQEVQLTAERDNLIDTMPETVAHLPEGEVNKPKRIIGDLSEKILEVLPEKLDKNNLIKLAGILEQSLASKQILFYFSNPDLEQLITERNWGGEMMEAPFDYLMVANTNIAGAKTDRVIRESINHQVTINADGTVRDKVTITREHTAVKNTPLVGVRNVNWLRVYVPSGSKLLTASGFTAPEAHYFEAPQENWIDNPVIKETEGLALVDPVSQTKVYQEKGKTVFANWVMVDPGQTSVVVLEYQLPKPLPTITVSDNWANRFNQWLNPESKPGTAYSLFLQKQPGSENQSYQLSIKKPESYQVRWQSDNLLGSNVEKQSLSRDHFYSVSFINN